MAVAACDRWKPPVGDSAGLGLPCKTRRLELDLGAVWDFGLGNCVAVISVS